MAASKKKTVANKTTAKKSTAKKVAKPKAAAPKKAATPKTKGASSLKEGDAAPQFKLQSDDGSWVSLKDLRGKTVVLYFYPKDLTPGCTVEACDFRDSERNLTKAGIVVLGVSKDSVELHQKFRDKHTLNFPLLSDADGKVCEAYGVWTEKSLYGRKFMGIERTTFVIDPQGRIQKVYPKVKVAGHVAAILADLQNA